MTAKTSLESYTEAHRHFLTDELPSELRTIASEGPSDVIVDLGCGDGRFIWALERAGLAGDKIYAVDVAPDRVARAERLFPKVTGIVADATAVRELRDASVDGVVCSQVIEHLDDDRKLADEIARIVRPGGWFFVESVLRGPRAWWIYRRDGVWLLDPTHVREYASEADFARALAHSALSVLRIGSSPLRFPVVDLIVRAASAARIVPRDRLSRLYIGRANLTRRTRALRVRVPGYRVVSAVGRRR